MSRSTKLTEEEKLNGKRKFLTPLPQTLAEAEMHPVTMEMFTEVVKKAIPPRRNLRQQRSKYWRIARTTVVA